MQWKVDIQLFYKTVFHISRKKSLTKVKDTKINRDS